jgi:hypothetical protein
LATDFSNFTRYFCSKKNIKFLSSCKEADITVRATHSNDIQLLVDKKRKMNPEALSAFHGLVSDWLALVLAQRTSNVGSSSFSETAQMEFYT